MRLKPLFLITVAILITAALSAQAPRTPASPEPPKTAVSDVKENLHGVEITDPYRWLEDQNSPETRKWIDAENEYTDSLLNNIPGQDALDKKVAALLKIETMNTPVVRGGRYFFTRRLPDQDQGSLFVRRGLTGKDELVVDPEKLDPAHTTSVVLSSVSHDGSLLLYGVRHGGEDEITPHLYDINAHRELADKLPLARYTGLALLPDKSGFYYTKHTADGPRVYLHKIGTASDHDAEIFGKGYGLEKLIFDAVSLDGHYLVITVSYGSAATKTDVYFQDLKTKGPVTPVVNDLDSAFFPSIAGDKLYMVTDWKAPNSRLVEVDLKNPAREHWREILPESDSVLEGISLVGGKVVAGYARNVVTTLKVLTPDGKLIREIKPPALGTLSGLGGSWDNSEGFYSFNSFYIPPSIYRYDVSTGKQSVWFQDKIPISADKYEVNQVWYTIKGWNQSPHVCGPRQRPEA